MAFSLFAFIDTNCGFLLNIIPYYFLLKLLILVWLQNPLTMGASVVYEKVIAPFRKKYTSEIDYFAENMNQGFLKIGDLISDSLSGKSNNSSKGAKSNSDPDKADNGPDGKDTKKE